MSAVEAVQPRDEMDRPGPEKNSEGKGRWMSKTTLHINVVCVLLAPTAQVLQGHKVQKNVLKKAIERFGELYVANC